MPTKPVDIKTSSEESKNPLLDEAKENKGASVVESKSSLDKDSKDIKDEKGVPSKEESKVGAKPVTSSKGPNWKIILPVLVILSVILGFIFWPKNQDTSYLDPKPLEATLVSQDIPNAAPADNEEDRLAQTLNSELQLQRKNSSNEIEFNWYMGWVSVQAMQELGAAIPNFRADAGRAEVPEDQLLRKIVPIPTTVEKKNTLVYEAYDIEAPIIQASLEDMFAKNEDGTLDFNKTIDTSDVNSPMQQKLKDGVVHLPISPQAGEVGNSYISGHSSNYSFVDSAYNKVFEKLEGKTKEGDEFYIYDWQGRKLKFRVFEAKEIDERDADEAWKHFPDKRVVTLQASVLKQTERGLMPTHRWITRGELVLDEAEKTT